MNSGDQINWSRMDLEKLKHTWYTEVEPALARNGVDIESRPTYQAVTDAGYSGIAYALREHHDLTLSQFLATVGYPQPGSDGSYPWGIDDETTIRELEWYLETNLRREGLADRTIDTKRSRLARFVRTYGELFDRANVVTRVREDSGDVLERDERQRVRSVFDRFEVDLESAESQYKHLLDVRQFYDRLVMDRDATFNPAAGAPHERNWKKAIPDDTDRDPPALAASDVRALVDACESVPDRLIVVATCAWGLRRGEVAALERSQFELEDGDPRIIFGDERKNGPGTVTIHYGLETLEDRIADLVDRDGWSGYLFPSSAADAGHVTPDTITARFRRLAERADVRVRGETPTPQYGRRFWYRTYLEAVQRLSRQVQAVADEQGSADARVVVENYLGEEEARRQRREFMREELAEAFGR